MSEHRLTNKNITTKTGHKQEISLSQSPLPSAEELAKLQKVDSDLPNKVFSLVEKEQAHRHSIDNKQLEIFQKNAGSNRFIANFGIVAGSTLMAGVLAGSGYLILQGNTFIGSSGIVLAVIAILGGIISKDKNTPI